MSFNFIGYFIYASLMSITPGPNNLMLLSYGKAYGLRNARNVMLGIFLGFFLMLCSAGYGIAKIITSSPTAGMVLKIIGTLWMLYLAFILRKLSVEANPEKTAAIGFGQAFSMQFINLKAWVMAISGASAYLPQSNNIHLNVFVYAISFGMVGIPCMVLWLKMGDVIAKFIKSEKASQMLGNMMFSFMIVSIITIWIQ